MSEGQLRKALDEHADSGERVGQILRASGAVTEAELESAVRAQIEDAAFDLLQWEVGDFTWESNAVVAVEIQISVSVQNLIMEASRRLDELEVIMRQVPGRDAVPALAPTPPEGAIEINIAPGEWRILVHVDGRRTVAEIAELVGLDEVGTMRTLYGLVSAGLLEVAQPDDADERPFVRPDLGPLAPWPVQGPDAAPTNGVAHVDADEAVEMESDGDFEVVAEEPVEPVSPAAQLLGELAAHPRLDAGPPDDSDDAEAAPLESEVVVDRAAVVRELASLFDERRSRSPEPGDGPTGPPDMPRRVEDDLTLNKGLIARLIDGVKGL